MAPSRRSARRPAHNASASNSKSSHSPQADERDSPPPPTTASSRKGGALKRVKEEPQDDLDEPHAAASSSRKRGKKAAQKEDKEKSPVDEPEPAPEEDEEESGVTRCPCGRSDEDLGFMIMCDNCKVWQHGSCMGVSEDNPPDEYFCEECRPDLHTDIPAKRKRTRVAKDKDKDKDKDAVAMPPPGSRSHSPLVKPKSPKRRNTMNSRDAAYEEQLKLLLAESGVLDEEGEETTSAPRGRKRKRLSADGDDQPALPTTKRPRSASTASDMPIAASIHEATTPVPSTNGAATSTKANKNGAAPKEKEKDATPTLVAPPAPARPKKRAVPRKEKEKEMSVDANGDSGPGGKKHPNQYTYRKEQQERRRAEKLDGGYQPSGARRGKGEGRAPKGDRGDRERDADQPGLASWALPDYLGHLAHILPTDALQLTAPASADGEDGERLVKVKWPGKRMTIGDMNKRVRNIVEFVAREQATSEQRRRRVDALEVARVENKRLGITAATVSRRVVDGESEDAPVDVDGTDEPDADAMAVDGEEGPGIWDIAIGPQDRAPTTEQLMADLMNDLIAFQEKFGMSKANSSGRAAARREAAVVASDRNGAAAAAAAAAA